MFLKIPFSISCFSSSPCWRKPAKLRKSRDAFQLQLAAGLWQRLWRGRRPGGLSRTGIRKCHQHVLPCFWPPQICSVRWEGFQLLRGWVRTLRVPYLLSNLLPRVAFQLCQCLLLQWHSASRYVVCLYGKTYSNKLNFHSKVKLLCYIKCRDVLLMS